MADTKVIETRNEIKLRELNEKADLPQRETAVRAALTDLVAKEKSAKERADADKIGIDESKKIFENAEADLTVKEVKPVVKPVVEPVVEPKV